MPLIDPADRRPIHFVGIAGAGMSALAELFVRRGATVTGCDSNGDPTGDLARLGIAVAKGHDPSHVSGARALVVTSALARDHPETERARALGIPVIRRAEALAEAVSGGVLIAIAGTHGKTTTTVMTTEGLAAAGRDPTGVAGGRVGAWGGNLRPAADAGHDSTGHRSAGDGSAVYVVEADEYDRSFLALKPTVAVVTNVEADHLDIYSDLADIRSAFVQFAAPARTIVLCADDEGANSLPVPQTAEILRYGTASPDARIAGRDIEVTAEGSSLDVVYDDELLGRLALRVPGLHNVRNALAAVAAGIAIGVTLDSMRPGLEGFIGVERRFQRLGETAGVSVIDDYAHHPTEIRATIDAARAAFPRRRIIAAFQPHLYSRTRDLAAGFGSALATADLVFLTDIYPAREQPIAGVTATLIADAVVRSGRTVTWQGSRPTLAAALTDTVRPGDVVLTLGAGDITRTGPELLRALATPGPGAAGIGA